MASADDLRRPCEGIDAPLQVFASFLVQGVNCPYIPTRPSYPYASFLYTLHGKPDASFFDDHHRHMGRPTRGADASVAGLERLEVSERLHDGRSPAGQIVTRQCDPGPGRRNVGCCIVWGGRARKVGRSCRGADRSAGDLPHELWGHLRSREHRSVLGEERVLAGGPVLRDEPDFRPLFY